jgi:LysM repeat protein
MQQLSLKRLRSFVTVGVIVLAVAVAGCTRSRSTEVAPTGEPSGSVDATFEAILSATQTAIALAPPGSGGGEELTPTPTEVVLPTVEAPTETPVPPTAVPPTPTQVGPTQYTVQQGEWIYKIARDHGVDPNALIAANPGIDPNNLQPGQVLTIPAPGASAPPAASPTTYTVQPGEWIYQIARKLGKDPQAIIDANPGINPNVVYAGQVLNIP